MAMHLRRTLTFVMLALTLPLMAEKAGDKWNNAKTGPTAASFTVNQLEHYLSDDGIAYIRPGLKVKVNSVTIGSDKKIVVDLNITDNFDQPLDRLGKTTPGAISISFIMAGWDPANREFKAITTRTQTTPATSPRPGVSAVQAGTDSGGTWTDLETGHAKYTFRTLLPTYYDMATNCTLAIYATRNLQEQIRKSYYANLEYDFRPDGQAVTAKWDKINQATSCNNCHNPLSAHGGSRQNVKLCQTCHNSMTVDPDTGNTVDMKVMAHKIHFGPNLPSVKAGKAYTIIGNSQSLHDYSHVTMPQDVRNCKNCHEGTNAAQKPSQAMAYLNNPSAEACGSCHDDVNFVTGENHPAGKADNSTCARCHIPDSGQEFDASVKGAHVIPAQSKQLQGLKASIVSVTDLVPGKKTTVVFKITNNDGTAVDGTKLATFGPMIAGSINAATPSDYSKYIRGTGVKTFDAATGNTTWVFDTPVPADAIGTWAVSVDIRRNATIKRADGKPDIALQEAPVNPIKYVAVKGTLTPRRTSVTMAQCNTCHQDLALHGGQRKSIEECVMCHNPTESDISRRPASAGQPESVSMQRMIHRIHMGHELTQDYTVYGYGGTPYTFNEVAYPGDRTACVKCHTSSGYTLPLRAGTANVTTLRDYFTSQGPATAACLGCHDSKDAAAHAYLNTTTFGGTTPAESCATCHGTGKDWDVARMHAK